ncbi:MAG: hypothetical protein GEU96_20330, partial [Propionibacteriales bacterium]|nr:hypothetical protein [Propionibacteriales bacterium]
RSRQTDDQTDSTTTNPASLRPAGLPLTHWPSSANVTPSSSPNVAAYTVEAALYFACLEAIQNAVKHSDATQITVTLTADSESVRFDVTDNGRGFDPHGGHGSGLRNVEDPLGALGGRMELRTAREGGTTVLGSAPISTRP